MEEYQQRVVNEQVELLEKVVKLQVFIVESPIFKSFENIDRMLLEHQLSVMRNYSLILGERIKRFKL